MITIIRRSGLVNQPPLARREFQCLISAMLQALECPADTAMILVLTNDRESAELNITHLGCRGPTNILSFPENEEKNLGTLVLNVPALCRECLLYGQSETEHLIRLLAHGLTHLLGYDHGPTMDVLSDKAFREGLALMPNLHCALLRTTF